MKATTTLSQVVEDTEDTRRVLLLGFTNRADAQGYQNAKAQFTNFKTKWEYDFSTYKKYVTSAEGKASALAMQESFSLYMTDADQIWKLIEAGKDVEARPILTTKSKASFEQVLKDMNTQMDFQATGGNKAVADAQATETTAIRLLLIIIVAALIAGTVIAIMLARHISRPLSAVTKVAQAVAGGT
ncbi:MAG TPA: MCP four helix bundle domain-containing protein [Desulfosporosinus sp.]